MEETSVGPHISRRRILGSGAALAGAALVGACGGNGSGTGTSNATTAVADGAGPKRKLIWALAAIAPWNTPADVGFIDATRQLGWSYQKVGLPIAQYSPENVVKVINQAIVAKPDVLVTPAWVPGVVQAAETAQKQGIFVMFNNANNTPDDAVRLGIPYVGTSDLQTGINIGPVFVEALAKKAKSGIVLGSVPFAGNENLNSRIRGAKQAIDAHNKAHGTSFEVELFVDESGGKSVENGVNAYKAKIAQLGDDLVGILCSGSVDALVLALRAAGKKPGDYTIVVWDQNKAFNSAIQEGWAVAGVTADVYAQGYVSAQLAWAQLERGSKATGYGGGGVVFDKANIEESVTSVGRYETLAKKYKVRTA